MFRQYLYKVIIVILCLTGFSLTHANNATKHSVLDEATEIASLSAVFLYNLDRDKLQSTLKIIFQKNTRIKAVRIIDSVDGSIFFTFYRYNSQLVFNERIPFQLLQYERVTRTINYNQELLGSIELFYETPLNTDADSPSITTLNDAEKEWIENNPSIKVGVFNWAPIIAQEGEQLAKGLIIDYLNLIAQQSDLHFEYIHGSFNELMSMFSEGKIDLLPGVTYHPERESLGIFSRSLINVRYHFFVRESNLDIRTSSDLKAKRIAVMAQDIATRKIALRYPEISLIGYQTHAEMIDALLNEQVDGIAAAELPLFESLEKRKIAGIRGLKENIIPIQKQQILIQNQAPLLSSIIEKTLSNISEQTQVELLKNYGIVNDNPLEEAQPEDLPNTKVGVLIGFFFVILALLYFGTNYLAKKRNLDQRTFAFGSPQFTNLIRVSITIFLTIIAGVIWLLLDKSKSNTEQKISNSLAIAISSSEQELYKIKNNFDSLNVYFNANSDLTNFLYSLKHPTPSFDHTESSRQFSRFSERYRSFTNDTGVAVLGMDKEVLIRTGNRFDHNAILKQHENAYTRALQGNTALIAPHDMSDQTGQNQVFRMYLLLPIKLDNNEVGSIIMYEVQPAINFYSSKASYIAAKTGDLFAVNRQAETISSSRFDQRANSNNSRTLSFPNDVNTAIDALSFDANTIHNSGYHHPINELIDYRNKKVFAQLHWLAEFDIGIVAKVDQDEALAQHHAFRSSLLMIMLLMLAFTIPALLITLSLGRKANDRLRASHDELEHMVKDRTTDLVAMEQHTRLLLTSIGQGLFGLDQNLNVTFINKAALNILGYDNDSKVDPELCFFQTRHSARSTLKITLESGRALSSREHIFTHSNGRTIPVELTSHAIVKQQKIVGCMVAFNDISEQIQLQTQLEEAIELAKGASHAKSQFLANMSHEIRTPMNAILGMSHLVLQTPLSVKQKNFIEKVHRSAQSLLGIINDILDFSKIEAGRLEMEQTSFYLDDILDEIADVIGIKTAEKGIEFMFDVAAGIPQPLIGDPLRLKQVLLNLSSNAAKFTEQGEIVLKVAPPKIESDQVQLTFSIRDTGIGMSDAEIDGLFESFSQADTSTTRKYGGTGLGLAICKRLVTMMKGDIWVESKPQRGTCFYFNAWLQRSTQTQTLPPVQLMGTNQRALIVDDCHTSRLIMKNMLAEQDYRVETCPSGKDALELLAKYPANHFQLILLDWKMPDKDGHATAIEMNHFFKRTEYKPKVIMITAFDKEDASAASQDIEFIDGYISKPLTKASLLSLIENTYNNNGKLSKAQKSTNKQLEELTQQLNGSNVLIVEDNDLNQELISELLTNNGLQVTIANNGQEALDILRSESFDGILMDCEMPIMDGYEATGKIREQAQYRDLPILAMTAHAMAGDSEKVIQAGMNEHIVKPIDVLDLFTRMAKWIKPSRVDKQLAPTKQTEQKSLKRGLQNIVGLDIEAGLATCQDNAALYEKLLTKFVTNHANFEETLASSSASNRDRLIHTLKGVSGNIGAKDLYDLCCKHEQLVEKGGDSNNTEHESIKLLANQVFNLSQAITSVLSEEPEISDTDRASDTLFPHSAQLNQSLNELKNLLEECDTDAVEVFEEVSASLSHTVTLRPLLSSMAKSMANYDFENVSSGLTQLEKALQKLKET